MRGGRSTIRRARRAAALTAAVAVLTGCAPGAEVREPADGASSGPSPTAAGDYSLGRSEPVADPLYPGFGNPDLDVLHYGLDLAYTPGSAVLTGTATLTIRPVTAVDDIVLDFSADLTADSADVDGATAPLAQRGDDIVIEAALGAETPAVVTVRYHGTPRKDPAPTSRGDFTAEGVGLRPEADGSLWTMQEPYGAYTWYPVNDHPSDEALYDISVTVPDGWAGVASGRFAGRTAEGDTATYAWHSDVPVASYLTTLAVDEYEKLEYTGPHDLPVTAWVPAERVADFETAVARIPEHIAYLEKRYGPYPFDSAGVVVTGGRSAMETQQMITFSAVLAEEGPEAMANVLVHELAHHWFGDAVTPRDWRGVWLSEGMATYVDGMWAVDQGWLTEEQLIDGWRADDQRLRDESGPPGDYDPGQFATSNVYICPALMLHEIREAMDEPAFTGMLRDWVQTQPHTHQDRASFTAWVDAHAATDLTGLIDAWLDSPTTPA